MARPFDELTSASAEIPTPPSLNFRPGRVQPTDPLVDTFRQRFAPFSSDPVGDQIEQIQRTPPDRIIRPGTRERFLDPTKIISMLPGRARGGPVEEGKPYKVGENGPEAFVPAQQVAGWPEGFTPVEGGSALGWPAGFTPVDQPSAERPPAPTTAELGREAPADPVPAPNAGMSEFPDESAEGAREVAAQRLARQVQPSGGRQEGATTRAIEGLVPALGNEVMRGAEVAKRAVQTGDIPPDEAMQAALLANPASVAYRTGVGIAKAALTPAELAQRETGVMSIPRAADAGPVKQAAARVLSAAPVGGGPVRRAAERASAELEAVGSAAAARPTGAVVDQARAGQAVVGALKDVQGLPTKLQALAKKTPEDSIGEIVRMAGSKTGADIASLAKLRRMVPAERHGEVQSAVIQRLGQGPKGEWDPNAYLRQYGSLSDRGKNVLFGTGEASLRRHLDAIESVSKRAPSWQQFQRSEGLSARSKTGTAAVLGVAAFLEPITLLTLGVGARAITRGLAKPATAAPIAQWSRAYERVARSGGTPQTLSAFALATKNLNTNLGTDADPAELLKRAQDEQPLE